MDTFDLSGLTPDDLKALAEQIASRQSEPDGDDRIDKLCTALEFVTKELESVSERVNNLQTLVMDDLFGALEKQYKDNARSMSISDLESKYGEMMAPHMGSLQALAPDAKVFDELLDLIEEAKSSAGDDWDEDTFVKGQITDLGDRLSKAMAARAPDEEPKTEEPKPEEGEAPKGEVTVTTETKPKAPDYVRQAALKMIR